MKNVIRGLHFQDSVPQAKLVSVISGSVWDVIVDLRPERAMEGLRTEFGKSPEYLCASQFCARFCEL